MSCATISDLWQKYCSEQLKERSMSYPIIQLDKSEEENQTFAFCFLTQGILTSSSSIYIDHKTIF